MNTSVTNHWSLPLAACYLLLSDGKGLFTVEASEGKQPFHITNKQLLRLFTKTARQTGVA